MRSPSLHVARDLFSLLRELRRAGLGDAAFSSTAPRLAVSAFQRWLGPHATLWPLGMPAGARWSIVSSRLPRALDAESAWFAQLRDACFDAATRRAALVCVEGTASAPHVRHAAQTLQLRWIDVRILAGQDCDFSDPRAFARDAMTRLNSLAPSATPLWLIPVPNSRVQRHDWICPDAPLRDRAAVALGDVVRPLMVRRGGVLERLLDARRADSAQPDGWSQRILSPLDASPRTTRRGKNDAARTTPNCSTALQLPWPALLHCTRRCDGPWPGQSRDEYQDELLWSLATRDRSPCAALRRIVAESRVRSSATGLRGGCPMACFADARLQDLAELRRYRRHRRRWDFEPYGIAIRRDWLAARGARPVAYGDDDDWRALPSDLRPWFQPRGARIDWRAEREWRVQGDVDLNDLTEDDAVLFVASQADARILQPLNRWRVIWLAD